MELCTHPLNLQLRTCVCVCLCVCACISTQARDLAMEERLLGVLDVHGLHERLPMLHDLVERTIRIPAVSFLD